MWINRGAEMIVRPGAQVLISGDLQLDSSGYFENSGTLHLNGNLHLDGHLHLSGEVIITGDVYNDGRIDADAGIFEIAGGDQVLAGDGTYQLPALLLSGSGVKRLNQQINTRSLKLGDRVLETGPHKLYVTSEEADAVETTGGWVRSDSLGGFFRAMSASTEYLFPIGGQSIYAPVQAGLVQGRDTLGFRFADRDANQEGLYRNFVPEDICLSNSWYFTLMSRGDTSPVNLQLMFPSQELQKFQTMLSASLHPNSVWNHLSVPLPIIADSFVLYNATVQGRLNEAYLLARKRPEVAQLIGPDSLCSGEEAIFQAHPGSGVSWTTGKGVLEQNDSIARFFSANALNTVISVIRTDSMGCSSFPAEKAISVLPKPDTGIFILPPSYPYENQWFTLNYTGSGASGLTWYSEGVPGGSDTTFRIFFKSPGVYPISLELFNEFGCRNQQDTTLTVIPGLELPDSFSPNGDGVNDELVFLSSGLHAYSLHIYNRWGVLVFSSLDQYYHWDGRDTGGELVAPGTYFYKLDVGFPDKPYRYQGSITVLY